MTKRGANDLADTLRGVIRDVPDFPKTGVLFRDITPVLADHSLFSRVVSAIADAFRESGVTHVAGIESRGFMFGAPVALALDAAFVPIRKPGKLPREIAREEYALEYGTDALEIHVDAMGEGSIALVVDDVLATGGTAAAACRLVTSTGARLIGCAVVVELGFLDGRSRLRGVDVRSLVVY